MPSANTSQSQTSVMEYSLTSQDGEFTLPPGLTADQMMDSMLAELNATPGTQTGVDPPSGLAMQDVPMQILDRVPLPPPALPPPLLRRKDSLNTKNLASSPPRGRRPVSTGPQRRSISINSTTSDLASKLKASECARVSVERRVQLLETELAGAKDNARDNETAWEHAESQRLYEVSRLQAVITHASEINQQLRWDVKKYHQEAEVWAKQAGLFKEQADILAAQQRASDQQLRQMQHEAVHVIKEAHHEREAMHLEQIRLVEQLQLAMATNQ